MTEDLTSLLKRALEVAEAATKGPWNACFGFVEAAEGRIATVDSVAPYRAQINENTVFIVAWRALAEPLLRVAMAANRLAHIKFEADDIQSMTVVYSRLERELREALARLSEVRW